MKRIAIVLALVLMLAVLVVPVNAAVIYDENPYLNNSRLIDYSLNHANGYFGNMWYDPDAGVFRLFYHNMASNVIYQRTSTDGITYWSGDTIALNRGSGWDASYVGVPFAWYESGAARPWRMLYLGNSSTIGLATSVDGVTWERKDTAGNALSSYVLAGSSGQWDGSGNAIDFGGVIKVGGTYYLYYDTINNPRKTGLATSTDLVSWTKHPGNPFFNATDDVAGTVYNATAGRFCGDIVMTVNSSSVPTYYFFTPHYTPYSSGGAEIEVYSSPSPIMDAANRTFVGYSYQGGGTANGRTVTNVDTPRWVTDDITRNITGTTVTGGQRWIVTTLYTSAMWGQYRFIYNMPGSTWSSNVSELFPVGGKPAFTLLPLGDSNTTGLWAAGNTGTLYEMTNGGTNPYTGSFPFTANGIRFNGTSDYAQAVAPMTSLNTINNNFTIEANVTLDGNFTTGYKEIVHFVNSTGNHHLHVYIGGAAGPAYTLSFATRSGGATHASDQALGDFSIGIPHTLAVTMTGGKTYFFKDGTLLNAGGSAFNYVIDTNTTAYNLYFGGAAGPSNFWNGTIDFVKISNTPRYTANYTPAGITKQYATTGTIFTGVYSFVMNATGNITLSDQSTPTGTSITILARNATSATDRSTTIGDFQAYPAFKPSNAYHQYAITLATTDTANTPSFGSAQVNANATLIPVAAFSATVSDSTVTFTDASTNVPTSWLWQYNQHTAPGWTTFSTDQNPSYNFVEGTYDINLTATNAAGSDSEVKTSFIVVSSGDEGTVFPTEPTGYEEAKARYATDNGGLITAMLLVFLVAAVVGVAIGIKCVREGVTEATIPLIVGYFIGIFILVIIFATLPAIVHVGEVV